MIKKTFVGLLAIVLLISPSLVAAQQLAQVPRIGIVSKAIKWGAELVIPR